MQGQRAMSYKQLFLLILTIWSAELFAPFLFNVVLPPQLGMEFRTVYLRKDTEKNAFLGGSLKDYGSKGWQMVSVQPDPDNSRQLIVFMQRQTAIRLDTASDE